MANLSGTYNLTTYQPNVRWVVSYTQTGRTSTTATYSFTVSMTLTSGQSYGYGYQVSLNLSQGGTTKATKELKTSSTGGTSWSTSFNATLSTDSNGGSIGSIRLWSTSSNDSTHSQQAINITGEVTKTAYATKPNAPTSVSVSGIFETNENIKITWSGATGTITKYKLYYAQLVDGNSSFNDWSYLKDVTGSSTTHSFTNIGTDRVKVKYGVSSVNSVGESSIKASNELQKPYFKVYNGSFKRGIPKVWNGTNWVYAKLKIWNGTNWVYPK